MLEDLTNKINELSIIGRALNVVLPQAYMATSIRDLKVELPKEIARRKEENNPVKTFGKGPHRYCVIMCQGAYNIELLDGVSFYEPKEFSIERASITDLSNNMRIFYTKDGPMPHLRVEHRDKIEETTRIYSPVFWYDVNKNRLYMTEFKDDMHRPTSPDGAAEKQMGPLGALLRGI